MPDSRHYDSPQHHSTGVRPKPAPTAHLKYDSPRHHSAGVRLQPVPKAHLKYASPQPCQELIDEPTSLQRLMLQNSDPMDVSTDAPRDVLNELASKINSDLHVRHIQLENLWQQAHSLLDEATGHIREDIFAFLDTLAARRANTSRHILVAGICIEARHKLEELRTSNGSRQCFREETTPSMNDILWTQGMSSDNNNKMFRTLMSLHSYLNILDKADLDFVEKEASIRCKWNALDQPNTVIDHLKRAGPIPLQWQYFG